ncbi:MAG: hypothetical protein ABIX28_04880 [Vicinamibacterales bacterium]
MLTRHLLSSILATPLLGAGLLLLVGRSRAAAIRVIALASALVSLALVVPFWMRYEPAGPPFQMREQLLLVRSLGSGYDVGADGLTLLFVLLIGLVSLVAVLISWARIGDRQRSHYARLLILQAAMTGVVLALDAVLLCVCWLVMLTVAGALQPVERAARWRLAAGALASAVMLLSGSLVMALAARAATGVASLDLTAWQQLSLPVDQQATPFVLLLTGLAGPWLLLVGRPSWPADPVRAEALALIRLGVLVSLPIYGLLRLNLPMLPQASRLFIPLLAGVGLGALWLAAVQVWRARDWVGVLSCAVMGQVGVMLLGLAVIDPTALAGTVIQPIALGLAVAPVLVWAGSRVARPGPAGAPPLLVNATGVLLGMAIVGVPGLVAQAGSSAVVRGASHAHPLWALAAGAGLLALAVGTVGRLWRARRASGSLSAGEAAMLLAFAIGAVCAGVDPAPIRDRLRPTMARVITRLEPGYAPAFSHVPGCGSAGPAPAAPAGFTAIAPCDTAPSPPK